MSPEVGEGGGDGAGEGVGSAEPNADMNRYNVRKAPKSLHTTYTLHADADTNV